MRAFFFLRKCKKRTYFDSKILRERFTPKVSVHRVQKTVQVVSVNGVVMLWSVSILATKTVEQMELVPAVVQAVHANVRTVTMENIAI